MGLLRWQERVVEEKRELDEKLEKLRAFLETDTFASLGELDNYLLVKQFLNMRTYSYILDARIARFSRDKE